MKSKSILGQLHAAEKKTVFCLISQMVFFFFLASIGGFLWEVLIFLFKDGSFCNRGFLYGPWLPIYGTGAVLFYLLLGNPLQRISHSTADKKQHPVTIFFSTMLIGTLLELGIGYFLDVVWGLRYWDYSGYFFNFRGYICLASALGFGFAGTVWICFLSGFITRLWLKIPRSVRNIINIILLLIFAADCAAALTVPNAGTGITFSLSFVTKNT
ncbi:MAG: putative ABC transporter permease [Clostridium sp.]|nr:putative ABC transporter permease [Clostridium sp.]MCM1398666.1 putative ABC transporter permease [Clostridium sp.]MCM1458703.1 putative ABC transporter permease [Bacteroides sp.]